MVAPDVKVNRLIAPGLPRWQGGFARCLVCGLFMDAGQLHRLDDTLRGFIVSGDIIQPRMSSLLELITNRKPLKCLF